MCQRETVPVNKPQCIYYQLKLFPADDADVFADNADYFYEICVLISEYLREKLKLTHYWITPAFLLIK